MPAGSTWEGSLLPCPFLGIAPSAPTKMTPEACKHLFPQLSLHWDRVLQQGVQGRQRMLPPACGLGRRRQTEPGGLAPPATALPFFFWADFWLSSSPFFSSPDSSDLVFRLSLPSLPSPFSCSFMSFLTGSFRTDGALCGCWGHTRAERCERWEQ